MTPKQISNERELQLLVSFLDDESKETIALAQKQLRELRTTNEKSFLTLLNNISDESIRQRGLDFSEACRRDDLELEFRSLSKQGENLNLELGAYLLSKFAYPQLTFEEVARPLDSMSKEVNQVIGFESSSESDRMDVLRRYLFRVLGFLGNTREFSDPDNSFINRVLERRLGIPISLSCLYLFLAWRLEMKAYGIGLPGHFIVGHQLDSGSILLDPYHEGRILSTRDCETIVKQHGLQFREEYLLPTSKKQILGRMILNLLNSYSDRRETDKAEWWAKILPIFQDGN